jgi:hypothetical protein
LLSRFGFLKNTATSAGNFVGNIVKTVVHRVDTLNYLGKLIAGRAENIVPALAAGVAESGRRAWRAR